MGNVLICGACVFYFCHHGTVRNVFFDYSVCIGGEIDNKADLTALTLSGTKTCIFLSPQEVKDYSVDV